MLEKIVRKGIKARISDISFCILKSTFELLFLFKAMVNYIEDMCDAGGGGFLLLKFTLETNVKKHLNKKSPMKC